MQLIAAATDGGEPEEVEYLLHRDLAAQSLEVDARHGEFFR